MSLNKKITLAWSGASGAAYGLRLLQALIDTNFTIYLIISDAAKIVFKEELGIDLGISTKENLDSITELFPNAKDKVIVLTKNDWHSAPASGSSAPKQMVICPCSMGTLASVSIGISNNILTRAADVILKERGELILVPRETPLSEIHLENMLKLTKLGAIVLPAMPGFYHRPENISDLVNFVVARILDKLKIKQDLCAPWSN